MLITFENVRIEIAYRARDIVQIAIINDKGERVYKYDALPLSIGDTAVSEPMTISMDIDVPEPVEPKQMKGSI